VGRRVGVGVRAVSDGALTRPTARLSGRDTCSNDVIRSVQVSTKRTVAVHSDGAFMEPSRRNQWQSTGKSAGRSCRSPPTARLCGRLLLPRSSSSRASSLRTRFGSSSRSPGPRQGRRCPLRPGRWRTSRESPTFVPSGTRVVVAVVNSARTQNGHIRTTRATSCDARQRPESTGLAAKDASRVIARVRA
jgi:hypothetical protein